MAVLKPIEPRSLISPEALADPYPVYAQLRRDDPVHWSDELQAWVLTRYDDVVGALRDPRLSSDRISQFARVQLHGLDLAIVADYLRVVDGMMLMKDIPHHARLRRMAGECFTRPAIERWRPAVRKIVDGLLDRVQGKREMDLVKDLAQPLPATVMAEMFGIPEAKREAFQVWSDDMARFFGGTFGDIEQDARRGNTAIVELERLFLGLIAERRHAPAHDLMSLLIACQEDGRINEGELTAQCVLIAVAGHVTTIDQLGNGVSALLSHPDQWQRLCAEPALLGAAVEEILRYQTSVPFIHRIAREPLAMGGKTIAAGQVVFLGLAAANRDPAHFPDPDRFDVARHPTKHLAFGLGPHLCLGAELARRELEISFQALIERMPRLRLAERPAQLNCESLMFRGFHSLPLAF